MALQQIGTHSIRFIALGMLTPLMVHQCTAQEIHWSGNAGNGDFFDGGNWSPLGAPQNDDIIRIGNLPGTAGASVMMGGDWGVSHDGLYLSNGVTLDMNGSELLSFGTVSITGNNTRLIARPAPFLNQQDFQGELHLGSGAHFELQDNVEVIFFPPSTSSGTISGRGTMITRGFTNDGVIRPNNSGGLILNAGQVVQDWDIDLDGTTGNGSLQLTNLFGQLHVNAGNLTDSFSSSIAMVPGALLNMNILDGWTADSNSLIAVSGFNNAATSILSGSHLTFGGTMNVSLAEGKLLVQAPTTIQSTASINVGHTDSLRFSGNTNILGGSFNMGQFATLEFNGVTDVSGGSFNSFAPNFVDGSVVFNGLTFWQGNVTLTGSARQQGNAHISGGGLGATISADLFDMDGLSGTTVWNLNSALTINADQISTTGSNRFGGTINVNGGTTPRLTLNLSDPSDSWTMSGVMNLAGSQMFFDTRVAGSHMIVQGDLNVTGGRVRINSDTTFADAGFAGPAQVSLVDNGTELRMHGVTVVESGVEFIGSGTMINAASGAMLLESGVSFNDIGLVNEGLLNIANGAGIATVDHFASTGIWSVDIGGYLAGTEHDLLLVTGGSAELGGDLQVRLIEFVGPDFFPEVGDEFTILSALAGINGTFVLAPTTTFQGQTYHWDVHYNPHDVTLQLSAISVPEPAAGLLLTLGGLVCGLRRRRRVLQVSNGANVAQNLITGLNDPSLSPQSARIGFRRRHVLNLSMISIAMFGGVSHIQAQQVDWNAGVGLWSNGANWDPIGVPAAMDDVSISNGSGAMVNLNQQAEIASLSIYSGSALNTQSAYLNVLGDTLVSGFGGFSGLTPSRLYVGSRDGLSIRTEDLAVRQGATIQFDGGIADIYDRLTIDEFSRVEGLGFINLFRTGTSLINDGIIEAGTNYGLVVHQLSGGGYDLDGLSGNGIIQATDYDSANNWGARIRLEGTHLTDSFSGQLTIGSGAELAMNLSEGWTVDAGGEFLVGWNFNTIEAARITGGSLDFSGEINMLGSDEIVASDLEINSSQIRIREAARIDTSHNNVLSIGGNATSLVHVDGGQFSIGQSSRLEFNAPTEINGGTFQSSSSGLLGVYGVEFNNDTYWSGNTYFEGGGSSEWDCLR